jgi:hemolysin activation/secretion protein
MISRWLIASFLVCTQIMASEISAAAQSTQSSQRTSPTVRGIFVTNEQNEISAEGRPRQVGLTVTWQDEVLIEQLRPFLGLPTSKETITSIKKRIQEYYQAQGLEGTLVRVPSQKTNGGVVQFLVVPQPLIAHQSVQASSQAPIQQQAARPIANIQGIFLTHDKRDVQAGGMAHQKGLRLTWNDPSLKKALKHYVGIQFTKKNILAIKSAIQTYYKAHGLSSVTVEVPSQKTVGGVLQIVVSDKSAVADNEIATPAPAQKKAQAPITSIQGIFLTHDKSDVVASGMTHQKGLLLTWDDPSLMQALNRFVGVQFTKNNVLAIKNTIQAYYKEHGLSGVTVEVPSQKTVGGVLQIVVGYKSAVAANSTQAPDATSTGLQGIILTGQRDTIVPEGRPSMTGIRTVNLQVPGGSADLKKVLEPYLGQKVSRKTLIAIKQKIMNYYVSNGMSMIGVELPAQRTKGGVVQFLVIQKSFGKPVYKGEIWYDDEQLNRYLGINAGQDISEDALQNNLSWLNKNPFHVTTMRFVPSDDPNVLNIEFDSKTRRPIRLYERMDNTGSASTGYGRFASGLTWGNALWIGDIFSFEYQFSNEFKRLQSYTATYTALLSWKHIFTVLASFSTVKPEAPKKQITAHSTQVRPRYTIPFKPLYAPLQQSLTFGFDYKNSNNSILNLAGNVAAVQPSQSPTVTNEINVTQLVAGYTLYDAIGNHSVSFNVTGYLSPVDWLSHQSNFAYNKLRPNSIVKYGYINVAAADVITIPKIMTISLLVRGQVSTHTLPPTELMSMGGFSTVRGYHESEIAGDNGFIGNLELRSLPFSVFSKIKDQLLFLAFLDYGVSNNWYIRQPKNKTIPNTQYLLGVGPGLRYTINPYLQVRVDYGFKLHRLFIASPSQNDLLLGFGEWHIGALASF